VPESPLTAEELKALASLDTPTVCNALEVVAPARRGFGYTVKPFVSARPQMAPIVGYARTATIRAMHPPDRSAAAMRDQRLEYYRYVGEGPKPSIMVIADLDPVPGYGAYWGEVQSNLHKGWAASASSPTAACATFRNAPRASRCWPGASIPHMPSSIWSPST
jgi:hypothetical protein